MEKECPRKGLSLFLLYNPAMPENTEVVPTQEPVAVPVIEAYEFMNTSPRPVAYWYEDQRLGPYPLPVFEANIKAWWMDGGVKLEYFFNRFRMGDTVIEACSATKISYQQYRDFKLHHPWCITAIDVYRRLVGQKLKEIVVRAAIGDPENGILPNPSFAIPAFRMVGVKEVEPEFRDLPIANLIPIPPGGTKVETISEDILDKDGMITVRRRTAQVTENHGTGETN